MYALPWPEGAQVALFHESVRLNVVVLFNGSVTESKPPASSYWLVVVREDQ